MTINISYTAEYSRPMDLVWCTCTVGNNDLGIPSGFAFEFTTDRNFDSKKDFRVSWATGGPGEGRIDLYTPVESMSPAQKAIHYLFVSSRAALHELRENVFQGISGRSEHERPVLGIESAQTSPYGELIDLSGQHEAAPFLALYEEYQNQPKIKDLLTTSV